MSLFRAEVFESRRFRLHGEVMLIRSSSNWLLVCLILTIVMASITWIVTGHYARTEKVVGRIVPDGALTKIVPSRAGVITRLSVHEGDSVKVGQPLVTITVEQGSADRADPTAADLGAIDRQHALLDQQIDLSRQAHADDEAKLRANIAQFHAQIASLTAQLVLQTRAVQSAKDSFEPLAEVTKQGFISKTQYEQRRQAYLASQLQLAQIEAQRAQLIGQLHETEVVLSGSPTQTASKVNDLMTSQASLVLKRIEVENARSYVITAPAAGRVSALQVTEGSSVASQAPLMSIVNDGAKLVAELYAPSRAIGFARPGQEVRLMYDAFPYQRFGSFAGRIKAISRTVLAPNEIQTAIDVKEPVYRIRVGIADQTVAAFGEAVPLQPGMTLYANIVLDRRSFLDWLLEPINAVRNRT